MLLRNVWLFRWCGMRRPWRRYSPRSWRTCFKHLELLRPSTAGTLSNRPSPCLAFITVKGRAHPKITMQFYSASCRSKPIFQWKTQKRIFFYKCSKWIRPPLLYRLLCILVIQGGETLGYTIRITQSSICGGCEERVWLRLKQENSSFNDFFDIIGLKKNIKMNFKSEVKTVLGINEVYAWMALFFF